LNQLMWIKLSNISKAK